MSKSWELVKTAESNFIFDRPVLQKDNTPDKVLVYLAAEVVEAAQAYEQLQDSPTPQNRKEYLQELADIALYLLALFRMASASLTDEVMEKLAFNYLRFPSKQMQEGEKADCYPRLKRRCRREKLKERFYGQ